MNGADQNSLSLAALLKSVWRRRLAMALIFASCVGASCVYTFFFAVKIYRSSVSIRTVDSSGPSLDALSPFLQAAPVSGFISEMGASENKKLTAVLMTRRMAHAVARRLNLTARYLEAERRRHGAETAEQLLDPMKAALALAYAHPDVLDGRLQDRPDEGILTMSDEALRRRMAQAVGVESLPDAPYPFEEIRWAWYRKTREAVSKIREGLVVQTDKNLALTIRFEAPGSAVLAADAANAFADELDKYFQETALTESSRRRRFIEARRDAVKRQLREAEDALAEFKRENGIVSLPDQVASIALRAGEIQALLESVKIERERLTAAKAAAGNPLLNAVERQIEELNRSLSQIETGGDFLSVGPIESLPDVEREYARLSREKKLQETLYLLLEQQYEIAKADEIREQAVFQALDRAEPDTRPARPRLSVNLLAGLLAALALSLIWTLIAEMVSRGSSEGVRGESAPRP